MITESRPNKTRQKGAERRRIILEAAAGAFAAHGYHAASIRVLAAAAGISQPVLYDHFASKQQLYVALLESVRDELTMGSADVMGRTAPAEERIRMAIDGFLRYVEARPTAASVLFTQPEGDPELVEAWRRVQTEATARLAALLAGERDLLPSVRGRALRLELWMEFLKRGLHGLAVWWPNHPQVKRRALVQAIMEIVWDGLDSQFVKSNPRQSRSRKV